ncbi:cytochrome b5-like heme/steroid binding domain-containing protein [Marinobacter sp.]|uniref:cytochrome b5 domain-containing protein n=1 Tax=Marinobacter sp. TaxID=50741 RepID=UPI001A0CC5B8|nr:cytochrome b5-like heme/steroid binding domain-containing protein [Marinobacter sp.]MBE0485415.1 cytochrome b5 domain-containing protein [Marinobacter sp.]
MTSNRIAYTTFVAFVSVVLTLVVVNLVQGNPDPSSASAGENARDEAVYRLGQVAEHNHAGSCWKAIDGVVYDLTEYLPNHPTEEEVFTRWCGQEATSAWLDKGNGRPHSPRAAARLEDYRIGVLEGGSPASATPQAETVAHSTKPVSVDNRLGQMMLGLAPGNYLDGTYRGNFIDRGLIQVSLQFRLEAGRIKGMSYRHLFYRDQDYLKMNDGAELYPVLRQYQQITERLEGEPMEAIFRLYEPQNVVDDIDGYSGATLRGAKVISAFRDGLNRGVYSW